MRACIPRVVLATATIKKKNSRKYIRMLEDAAAHETDAHTVQAWEPRSTRTCVLLRQPEVVLVHGDDDVLATRTHLFLEDVLRFLQIRHKPKQVEKGVK